MPAAPRFAATLEAFGHPEFQEALRRDVLAHNWQVPIHEFCRSGAWPELDPDLQLSVHRAEDLGDRIQITAFVSFTGRVPSYCNDCAHSEPADGFLHITLHRPEGEAEFEAEPLTKE